MQSHSAGQIEKLLKQVYQIHRKEIRDLESQLDLVQQKIITRNNECKKCSELERALEQKIADYDKLLNTKTSNNINRQFHSGEQHNEMRQKPEKVKKMCLVSSAMTESDVDDITDDEISSQTKFRSIFDGISPVISSSSRTEGCVSPVPETPLEFMDNIKVKSPTIITETLDDYAAFFNTSKTPSRDYGDICSTPLPPTEVKIRTASVKKSKNNGRNCLAGSENIDRHRRSNSPEIVILSPVLKRSEPKFSAVVIDDSLADEHNQSFEDFAVPKRFKRRREEPQKTAKLKITGAKTAGWKPSAALPSSAKFSFVPAQLGYRKPKYKQMTLSQTLNERAKCGNEDRAASKNFNVNVGQLTSDDVETQEDLDATYVPTQLLPEKFPTTAFNDNCDRKQQLDNKAEASDNKDLTDESDTSESEDLLQPKTKTKKSNELNDDVFANKISIPVKDERPTTSKALPPNFFDDFDELPTTSPQPKFKYVRDAVRKKDERQKLDGQICHECEKYYDGLGLSESEKKRRLNSCSRHRDRFARPKTPDHFWSLEFPTTQELKKRGIVEETKYRPLRERRMRPRQ